MVVAVTAQPEAERDRRRNEGKATAYARIVLADIRLLSPISRGWCSAGSPGEPAASAWPRRSQPTNQRIDHVMWGILVIVLMVAGTLLSVLLGR